jgi:hypothetical protein
MPPNVFTGRLAQSATDMSCDDLSVVNVALELYVTFCDQQNVPFLRCMLLERTIPWFMQAEVIYAAGARAGRQAR